MEGRESKRRKVDDERDIVDILSLNVVLHLITFFDISELLKFFYLSKWYRSLMYNETCSTIFKGMHQLIERLNGLCIIYQDDKWINTVCSQPTFYLQMEYVKDMQKINQLRCVSDDDKVYLNDRIGKPVNPDNIGEKETYYRTKDSEEYREILVTVNSWILDEPMTEIDGPLKISGAARLFLCTDLNLYIKHRGFDTIFFRRQHPGTKLGPCDRDFDVFEINEEVDVKRAYFGNRTIRVIYDYQLGVIRSCVVTNTRADICDTLVVNISECIKEDDLQSYFNVFKGNYRQAHGDIVIFFIRKIGGQTKYYAFFVSHMLGMTITHINLQEIVFGKLLTPKLEYGRDNSRAEDLDGSKISKTIDKLRSTLRIVSQNTYILSENDKKIWETLEIETIRNLQKIEGLFPRKLNTYDYPLYF